MDFTFTEEQQMLRASLRRFLADRYPFDQRLAASRSVNGLPSGVWAALANELGLFCVGLPEDHGGLGGGAVDHMIIMEELGRVVALEPYLETIVIGAELLSRCGGTTAQGVLSGVVSGEILLASAFAEAGTELDLSHIATRAERKGEGWLLSGRKTLVTGAPWASQLLIAARTSGASGDASGISLFLVDPVLPGITLDCYATIDGRRAADIAFDDVHLAADALLGEEGKALPLLDEVTDRAIAALCAEAVGVMTHLLEATLAYTGERKQFGKDLASFQVVRHRMADMLIEIELATSAVYMSTVRLDGPPQARKLAASATKTVVCAAARFVGQSAVQLHGAMGMTDELDIGHYFKRLMVISAAFGDADDHCARYISLTVDNG